MNVDILTIARQHLQHLSEGRTGIDLAEYLSPDIIQTEYPNQLNPHGGESDFKTLMERAAKGKKICVSQTYEVEREFVSGKTVILEVRWSGVFNVPIGKISPGNPLRAHFALFLEFQDGKIVRQRNYDCFETF